MSVQEPEDSAEEEERSEPPPPGHFVSGELKDQCARFLDEVKTLVSRRRSAEPPRG